MPFLPEETSFDQQLPQSELLSLRADLLAHLRDQKLREVACYEESRFPFSGKIPLLSV
jgi:hypothetical protein